MHVVDGFNQKKKKIKSDTTVYACLILYNKQTKNRFLTFLRGCFNLKNPRQLKKKKNPVDETINREIFLC